MDRAELRDRLRQELAKRQDSTLAQWGHDFAKDYRRSAATGAGNFFFRSESVDPILALMTERIPGFKDRIVHQAEQICRHRFDLLGYADLDYGSPIDWHLDAVHGKQAPHQAFYRVRYLDYAEVGDSKITWELNRHQHLVTLAKAYRLTGDRHYADEVLRQWRHWQAENPYPNGINWASSLEAGFRSLSWIWTYHLLRGSPGIPDLRDEWLRGLAVHGRHIERYLSTYFSPNTHLLGEGVALFFLGVLFPELSAAQRWKSLGWEIVLREAKRQVRDDGFHFEQSTYYHVYALDFFLHSAILASLNGIATPKSLEDTLQKMLTALYLLGRCGPPSRFGDDDGGRLFDPGRNRSEHLLDPLATGAILFHRGDFKKAAGGLREETIWLVGVEGVRQWDGLKEVDVSEDSAAMPEAGFYLLPGGAGTQLVVGAGPQGTQSGGHGHADGLSVCLQNRGRALLIDPGTYEYIGPGSERNLFRGTAMHNALRVDEADQAEIAGPFSWRSLARSKTEKWIRGQSFDLLLASHDGYQRLEQPVTHQRWVISLRNGIYLIRDVIQGQGKHRLALAWHLGPDLQLVEEGRFRVKDTAQRLALLPTQGHGWAEKVRQESWSPAYGQKSPMTVLNFSAVELLPAEFALLLVTWEDGQSAPSSFERLAESRAGEASGYKCVSTGVEHSFVFGGSDKPWCLGGLTGDAEFACWKRSSSGGAARLIMVGGSFVRVGGGLELSCARNVEWAELAAGKDGRTFFSSDMAALKQDTAASSQPASPTSE